MKLMTIKLTEVHVDLKLQARTAVDDNTIEDYRECYACGEKMPPVTVFYHKGIFHLTDGFHRVEAARQAGCEYIQARVFEGGVEEALWFSIGANKTHGLRRSNEDKRKSVMMALKHQKGKRLSDRQIARHCGVSNTFVSNLRKQLAQDANHMHKTKEKEQHSNAKGPDDNEETEKGNQESRFRPENWVMEDEKCFPDEIYSDQPRSSSNRVSKQTFRSEVDSSQTKEDYKQKLKSFVDKQSETKRSVYPVTEKMEIIITLIAGHLTLIYNKAGLFPEAFDTPYWDATKAEEILESWKAVTHAMQKTEKELEQWLEKQNEVDKRKKA